MRSARATGRHPPAALATPAALAAALKASTIKGSALKATALATLGAVALTGTAVAAGFPALPGDPPAPPGEDPHSPRPDIVAIVLDDIPPLDGRLFRKLPNIRGTFVRGGTEFTDAHVETPTCTPGRAGLLTGLHTHNHGAYKTDGSLFDPTETIATELQAEGYHTIGVGKYLNLYERLWDRHPPGWDEFHGYGGGYYDYDMWSNGVRRHFGHKPRDYSTDVITRLTLRSLERAPADEPFFAWIAPFAMHKPWSVAPRHQGSTLCNPKPWKPAGYMEVNSSDKPTYVQARRVRSPAGYDLKRVCRGMLAVDDLVGEVVRKLDRMDRLDNTVLILTSDNGMAYGSQRILHDKKAPYGTQIPLFVRWERVLGTVPRQIGERVQNIDLAPTLCDIARCQLGPYLTGQVEPDGVSLLKLLTGERKRLGRAIVLTSYQETGHRVPTYRSVTTTRSHRLARQACAGAGKGRCRWMYSEYETGEVELYDLSNGPCYEWSRSMPGDPCMLDNKAGKKRFAGVERALRNALARNGH